MTASDDIKIARIVRVNHAGEYSAIRIYGAQILVSSLFWKPLVAELKDLQSHEIIHCDLFNPRVRPGALPPGPRDIFTKMKGSALGKALAAPIALAVEAVIWISTWGDSAPMNRDLAKVAA